MVAFTNLRHPKYDKQARLGGSVVERLLQASREAASNPSRRCLIFSPGSRFEK